MMTEELRYDSNVSLAASSRVGTGCLDVTPKQNGLPSLMSLNSFLSEKTLQNILFDVLKYAVNLADNLDCRNPYWDEEIDPYLRYGDKAIIESSLLQLLVARTEDLPRPHLELLKVLSAKLEPLIRSERNRALLMRFPHSAAAFGIGHAALNSVGIFDEEFDSLVRSAFSSGLAESTERIPYRAMDVKWLRGLLYPDEAPDFESLSFQSVLNSNASPMHMSVADVYAVTHSLMYLTDFGKRSISSDFDMVRVSSLVDSVTAWTLLSENIDVLIELVMSSSLCGLTWSPYTKFAMDVIIKTWNNLGFLPSPAFEVTVFEQLKGIVKKNYALRHTYHTTFVTGILCTLLLRHPVQSSNDFTKDETGIDCSNFLPDWKTTIEKAQHYCRDFMSEKGRFLHIGNSETIIDHNNLSISAQSMHSGNITSPEQSLLSTISLIRSYPGYCSREGAPWAYALDCVMLTSEEIDLVLSDAVLILACRDNKLQILGEMIKKKSSGNERVTLTFIQALNFLARQQTRSGAIGSFFVLKDNADSETSVHLTSFLAGAMNVAVKYVESEVVSVNLSGLFRRTDIMT